MLCHDKSKCSGVKTQFTLRNFSQIHLVSIRLFILIVVSKFNFIHWQTITSTKTSRYSKPEH